MNKPIRRLRLISGETDLAVRKNTPEITPPTINCTTIIFRINDIGPDHRDQMIAEPIRKDTKNVPKVATAIRGLGGTGRGGISWNIGQVYPKLASEERIETTQLGL